MSVDVGAPVLSLAERMTLVRRAEATFPDRHIEMTENGDIFLTMIPSRPHANIATGLTKWLRRFLPYEQVAETGHILTSGHGLREPDVMVFTVTNDQLPDDWATPASFVRLAVEIASPSNRDNDWTLKMTAYAASGIRYYWIVDTDSVVKMFELPAPNRAYVQSAELPLNELLAMEQLPAGVTL